MADTKNGPELHPMTKELAEGKNYAAVSTVLPSGRIQTQMLWVGLEEGRLVINTETHRKRYQNLRNDPRITVLIRDENDPYRYAEVRGVADRFDVNDRAREQIDELAQKYFGTDYPADNIKSERVLVFITPERQTIIDQNVDTSD
jgi:PPOX class probable F420-dependent enzyme